MIKKNPYFVLLIATAVIGLTMLVELVFRKPYSFHGTVINPPLPVTDFSLQTANEEVFRLSEQKGKIVLLFFGYTSCPDVCPVTLATFKQVNDNLGEDAQKVRFVMITADPDRDTPDKVAEYAARFNPEFIGLSGDMTALASIWKELGVFVEKQESDSAAGYLVSHTASVYVLNQSGSLFMTFPYGTTATEIADDIRQILKDSK
ncbi:MAG: SCO family protein [Chloroflexota bacterium]|jgi:protein SCO1/2|nr:SCO family protein [Chloroflexota bacterium]MBI5705004.1 SCO family protein [Chloroflexota bacterium]MBN8658276.1 SCO family protein [Anaerolineae bacterium]RJP47053.1 MAG: SCO family protein [Anaerolineaceae bacterium]HNC08126.1 SCO family protein [Anaerolineales bacterium]